MVANLSEALCLRKTSKLQSILDSSTQRCVRRSAKIERWDYVDDGSTFPKGTDVAQFAYYKTGDSAGWVTLDIGRVNDMTRITHAFTGIGAELPQQSLPPAMRAMQNAARALKASCGLDLSGMKLDAVGQRVEALK